MKIVSVSFLMLMLSISIVADGYTDQSTIDNPENLLKVSGTTISYSKEDGHNTITTIGTIKNLSGIRIDEPVLEVKYFDQAKRLIDTVTQPLYGVVVPASQEVSFRVRDVADKSKEAYISSSVRVVSVEQRNLHTSNSKKNSSIWLETFVSWLPMLILICVWVFFIKKMNKKDSPQRRSVELIENQNLILTKQLETLDRLASAVEKVSGGVKRYESAQQDS